MSEGFSAVSHNLGSDAQQGGSYCTATKLDDVVFTKTVQLHSHNHNNKVTEFVTCKSSHLCNDQLSRYSASQPFMVRAPQKRPVSP